MLGVVRLAPYDPTWPLAFEAEAARIERACAGLPLKLEHVGSTSVPGLSAKPVIDILAGRPPQAKVAPYVGHLTHENVVGRAWWSLEELASTHEEVWPSELAALVRDVIERGPPPQPIAIGS